jgi:hypothetical protein
VPGLVLPEEVTIRLLSEDRTPFRVPEVIVEIYTSGCRKNNYHLGPFFSDADGVVTITREMLERAASDELATGLMDYGGIGECAPDVAIRPWTKSEVTRAVEAREYWTSLLPGEAAEYRSIDELIQRYTQAANHRLRFGGVAPQDRWDGSRARVEYEYVVVSEAPA